MNLLPVKARQFVAKLAMSGFDAGSRTITRIRGWIPSNTDITTLIVADGDLMRARSRQLYRENPWARGAIDSFVSNAIGTGIVPRSQHPSKAMRKRITKAWDIWAKQCDANGMQNFYGLQATACRAIRMDGESFTRIRLRFPKDGLHVPLQLQLFEADHVPYTKNETAPDSYTQAGIQFGLTGQREFYHVYRDHPGSQFRSRNGSSVPNKIPADQIIHCFEVQRAGQVRGQIWMTSAILMLYDIKQLTDAALLRQKTANLLSIWIKRGAAGGGMLNETDNGDSTAIAGVTPGSVNYMNAGEEVEFLTPPESGVGFGDFIKSMLRAVARALGITYEQLTGDLSGVTFSSIRAGLNEFQRWCEAWQYQVMIHQFCERIWPIWIEQAILAGVLGDKAPGQYLKDPQNFLDVRWTPPGWKYVNPVDDVKAAVTKIRAGLSSLPRELDAIGESSEEVDAENEQSNARQKELGLKYDSNGANPANGPQVSEQTAPKKAAPDSGADPVEDPEEPKQEGDE